MMRNAIRPISAFTVIAMAGGCARSAVQASVFLKADRADRFHINARTFRKANSAIPRPARMMAPLQGGCAGGKGGRDVLECRRRAALVRHPEQQERPCHMPHAPSEARK